MRSLAARIVHHCFLCWAHFFKVKSVFFLIVAVQSFISNTSLASLVLMLRLIASSVSIKPVANIKILFLLRLKTVNQCDSGIRRLGRENFAQTATTCECKDNLRDGRFKRGASTVRLRKVTLQLGATLDDFRFLSFAICIHPLCRCYPDFNW